VRCLGYVAGSDIDYNKHRESKFERGYEMEAYPLVFRNEQTVTGTDYRLLVRIISPVLVVHEKDGWYFYGVKPGMLSAHGNSLNEVMEAGRRCFVEFFEDLAHDATQEAFMKSLRDAAAQVDKTDERRWKAALKEIRQGKTELAEAISKLEKHEVQESLPYYLSVDEIKPVFDEHPNVENEEFIAATKLAA